MDFRHVLEALPAATYFTDAEGWLTFFNDAAESLWGRRPQPGEDRWCGAWRLFRFDGSPMRHDESPTAQALQSRAPIQGAEAIAVRPDGSRVPFAAYPTPLFNTDGALIGAVTVLVDITDRKRTEEIAQHLAALVESSDDAIISKDLNGVITSWNSAAERLFGYRADEMIGKPVTTLMPPDKVEEETLILARIRRGERIDHYETVRQRKDGSLIDISLTISAIRNAHGEIVGASKIARDNTERRREIERQALLIGEMKHRAANLAAIVDAIARQSRPQNAPEVDRYIDRFMGRLQTLLTAGQLVLDSSSRTPDLGETIHVALRPFVESRREGDIAIAGPPVAVSEFVGGGLAMAFHELATNAFKYGALSTETGTATVSWTLIAQGADVRVEIDWREQGGPAVSVPTQTGFGTRVISSALAAARDGAIAIDYRPDGLHCRFSFLLGD